MHYYLLLHTVYTIRLEMALLKAAPYYYIYLSIKCLADPFWWISFWVNIGGGIQAETI